MIKILTVLVGGALVYGVLYMGAKLSRTCPEGAPGYKVGNAMELVSFVGLLGLLLYAFR